MKLSQHARIRMQQRGIPRLAVDWLAAYGAVDHQRGAELFYFDRRARQALERRRRDEAPPLRETRFLLDAVTQTG